MDFISRFEGLFGENLGSAVLGHLILNSQEIRDEFIGLLSDNSPVGPISYSSHFSSQTEYATSSEGGSDEDGRNNGRLDLLIQLDDVVIGIENKFFAGFQPDQPGKYIPTLEHVAKTLGQINRRTVRPILFILCPEDRRGEAEVKANEHAGMVSVITWESVIRRFRSIRAAGRGATAS